MPDWLDKLRGWIVQIGGIGLMLIPLALILQVLFGNNSVFLGSAVVDNLMGIIRDLGGAGLVGLIALAIILYLFRGMAK